MNRRQFLTSSLAVGGSAVLPAADDDSFSFVLLGDLHYDKLEHHDFKWLESHHPGDLNQIKNYSRITAEHTPALFDSVRQSVSASRASFVVQVGDLVEGLCGSAELAARQNREAVEFIAAQRLGVPVFFTKGNHDVTGEGAVEAFKDVFHPFLASQTKQNIESANYLVRQSGALFCFFDAYDKSSLEWLEAVLAKRVERHCFVVIHPPVVPYGARATWHIFSAERDQARRERLLTLLGQHQALVLGGHIHRYNTLVRQTPGGGRFAQFALSSVVNSADVTPQTERADYTPDQVRVEPRHSPATEAQRRAIYAAEAPAVRSFAYADLPGHAVVTVAADSVRVVMHGGVGKVVYRSTDLLQLMRA